MNGNFILLPTSSGHEWQFHIATESSGKEWQFHIPTDMQWSSLPISHCFQHLVVKIGNFTLLLTSSAQE